MKTWRVMMSATAPQRVCGPMDVKFATITATANAVRRNADMARFGYPGYIVDEAREVVAHG
jgi:hypothetical protein